MACCFENCFAVKAFFSFASFETRKRGTPAMDISAGCAYVRDWDKVTEGIKERARSNLHRPEERASLHSLLHSGYPDLEKRKGNPSGLNFELFKRTNTQI